jgi:hypothetical protein
MADCRSQLINCHLVLSCHLVHIWKMAYTQGVLFKCAYEYSNAWQFLASVVTLKSEIFGPQTSLL